MTVRLKITVSTYEGKRAIFYTKIPEEELRDFEVDMGAIRITIHNEGEE